MSRARFILGLLFVACTGSPVEEVPPDGARADATSLAMVSTPSELPPSPEPAAVESADPYAEYDQWCEDIFKQTCECSTHDSIVCESPVEPCPLDRTGKDQRCVRPQWARREGSNVYVCDPGWLNRSEQRRQQESQRLIVDAVCSVPSWADDLAMWGKTHKYGDDPSKLCWHLPGGSKELKECRSGHYCQPDKLAKFLALVAIRESTWNHKTSHELNLDVAANRASYSKARRKGWYEGNEHFHDAQRWARGYGWYGQNAALNVFRWDSQAPPEILCRRVESTEIYLRNARRSFKKLWSMYGDDKERTYQLDTGDVVQVRGVTWYDVHRAIAGGKLEPEEVIKTKGGFVWRARSKKIGLDPFETVMWEMLGEEIPRDVQNMVAEQIRQTIHNHFQPQASNDVMYPEEAAVGG